MKFELRIPDFKTPSAAQRSLPSLRLLCISTRHTIRFWSQHQPPLLFLFCTRPSPQSPSHTVFCPPQYHVIVVNVLLHRRGFDRSVLEVGFQVYLQGKCPAVATHRICWNIIACRISRLPGKIMIYRIRTTPARPAVSPLICIYVFICGSQTWPILYYCVLLVLFDDVSSNYLILHEHTFAWSPIHTSCHRTVLIYSNINSGILTLVKPTRIVPRTWFAPLSLSRPPFTNHWVYAEWIVYGHIILVE